ncbi:hypothetical protein [Salipiger bermudensis]|uniref:hypothetical protein n=1 Tax=Salipiger bermudensis TaxID=344736 RepID=UPI001CD7C1D7|nr:hypothetical protein [Salipiger bermudensis]MCA0961184.1 hypothetical protein [Salipiger bermudensis]
MTLARRSLLKAKARIKPVSDKRRKHRASASGQADLEYMRRVRALPCCACGKHGPSDAHHCRDLPDFNERGLYDRLPGAGSKSGDRDTIPLCGGPHGCHSLFHGDRAEFHRLHGKDYGFIAPTRATLSNMEIDF